MKITLFLFVILSIAFGQSNEKISSMDFVQVLNGNIKETIYYYQNNWKVLREKALIKSYIESFQLLETKSSKDASFQFVLITTYRDKKQYDLREKHFEILISERGGLKLLNDKKPNEFRKVIFGKDKLKHLE
jgi:hypothetical protein